MDLYALSDCDELSLVLDCLELTIEKYVDLGTVQLAGAFAETFLIDLYVDENVLDNTVIIAVFTLSNRMLNNPTF